MSPTFASLEDEVRFLRGLRAVQRMADEILEDCLARQLGLAAALDVFLTQSARMIHAKGAFVELRGTHESVLWKTWGDLPEDIAGYTHHQGGVPLAHGRTLFIAPLTLASTPLGALGFVLPGEFPDGGHQVMELVNGVAEQLDSAVLAFLALADGHSPLQKLDELSQSSAFRPSARLGKYELLSALGSGGMAQVLVARTLGPEGVNRLVALKRILPQLRNDETMVGLFLDEAKLGLKLQHENLVTVYDFGLAPSGDYFIAMELLKGVDLDQVLALPPRMLAPEIAASIVIQALNGLHCAHELKDEDGKSLLLVHRDVSPHNLMITFDGRVKVLDFGVAKVRKQRTVTLPGIVKGKPLYMSPEQATAERIDRRSDVFSVGLIFYEAVMGFRAFDKGDDTRSMVAIVNDPLVRPPGMPDPVWEVLRVALAKEPAARFQTARDFAARLAEVISPAPDHQVAKLMQARFPAQIARVETWEKTPAARSKLT
jgi:serine/threonine-protein kinase